MVIFTAEDLQYRGEIGDWRLGIGWEKGDTCCMLFVLERKFHFSHLFSCLSFFARVCFDEAGEMFERAVWNESVGLRRECTSASLDVWSAW